MGGLGGLHRRRRFLVAPSLTPAGPVIADNSASNAVAVLVDELDASFADGRSPQKTGFAPGPYKLENGLAHVRMINGTDLVLKAPVAFHIDDPMRVRLQTGDMRVVVPDTAHGFIVATDGVDYQDLGTEFGVSAGESGTSQMHVFDGQVDVLKTDGTKIESVTLGQTVAFAQGNLSAAPAPEKDKFPSASEIGMRRWLQLSQGWRDDPTLLCYYSFQKNPESPRELQDIKTSGVPLAAQVSGAAGSPGAGRARTPSSLTTMTIKPSWTYPGNTRSSLWQRGSSSTAMTSPTTPSLPPMAGRQRTST